MREQEPHCQSYRRCYLRNSKMPAAFGLAIGAPTHEQHADKSCSEYDRTKPTHFLHAPAGETLQHRGLPEPEGIATGIGEKQTHSKHKHRGVTQRLPDTHLLDVRFAGTFFVQLCSDPAALIRR